MSISYTWSISDLKRQAEDGYVFSVNWTLEASDIPYSSSISGSVNLERPDVLIPFEELNPEIVTEWVKDYYGSEQVLSIKESLATKISNQKSPDEVIGFPSSWIPAVTGDVD